MDKHVRSQLERIIDEGEGDLRSVIVQMSADEETTRSLLETASEAIRRRRMATSAREALPPEAGRLTSAAARKGRTAKRRRPREAEPSMALQLAGQGTVGIAKEIMKTEGLRFLNPLLESGFIMQSMEKTRRGSKTRRATKARPSYFWSSASALLELDKDALWKLPDEVPEIADIYPNRTLSVPPVVKIDPAKLPQQVKDNKTSAWGIHAIGALATWGAYGAKGKGVKIGLLDTGVDASHPELKGKIEDWAEFDSAGEIVKNSKPHDSGEHGTHCAGTIVGGNHNGQWIGVAPEAKLAVGLVLKGGSGTDAQILAGMQWAMDRGVHVISMSLGGLRFSADVLDTYTRTIINANRLGTPVVVAIGNEGSQTSGSPGNDYFAFAVGAVDHEDLAAGFSGGRTQVINESKYISRKYLPLVYSKPEISAPGVAVTSTVPKRKYETWNGTSMAAPHVAGAVALLLSATGIQQKTESNQRAYVIQDLLIGSVEELGEAGQDHRYGFGRLDVLRAIGFAKELNY